MRPIRVHLEDGTFFETDINGTEKEVNDYYVGKHLNIGVVDKDKMMLCTKVEFLDMVTVKAHVVFPVNVKMRIHKDFLMDENKLAFNKMILDEAKTILENNSIEPDWIYNVEG